MLKKWYALLLTGFIALLLCCPLPASAARAEVRIYDEGDRLTQEEYDSCMDRLRQAADKTGMNIGIVLGTAARSEYTVASLADSTYDQLFGHGTDGLLYYMDLRGYSPAHDYISTSGMGQFYYTNSDNHNRIEMIFDTLDAYLKPAGSEDVWGALMQFADEVEYYYGEGIPERYYYYDDEYQRYYYLDDFGNVQSSARKPYIDWGGVVLATFGAMIAGLLAAIITFAVVVSRYKFKYSLSPTTYVNQKQVEYRNQYDHFVRTHTSRIHIDSGGGSGGGGGGGGGGFSSGGHGGGGHTR